jgi:hypothetical protein
MTLSIFLAATSAASATATTTTTTATATATATATPTLKTPNRHLTYKERIQIHALFDLADLLLSTIAAKIGVSYC